MTFKIETATVTANNERSLKEDWTVEMDTIWCQHSEELADEIAKVLMEESNG